MQKTTLVWFRRNLRLADNAVLRAAAQEGLPLAAVFVFDRPSENDNPRQTEFLYRSLQPLHQDLGRLGIPLFVERGDAAEQIAACAARLNAAAVWADESAAPDGRACDNRTWRLLDAAGVRFERANDRNVFAKNEIMGNYGSPIADFESYRQAWLRAFEQRFGGFRSAETCGFSCAETRYARFQTAFAALPPFPERSALGITETDLAQTGGEAAAWQLWQDFEPMAADYALLRAFAAKKYTAQLGPYLSAGCISPRMLAVQAAQKQAHSWLDNLILRDFYHQQLFHFPPSDLGWAAECSAGDLARWQQGQTGFPLIDAAMRCLNAGGWLHPLLRQAVAEFWCGMLGGSWQHGAAWFARCQTDYDEAVNIGNWRTAAKQGGKSDRRRLVRQAQQLDPDGTFVRRHLPELAHLPKNWIHTPWLAGLDIDCHGYPPPMV
ncbi:DNA photolyase family protein [Neisseria sp. ZJ106]|uniref:Deoxyribodipyrimidine photo-lyase n=1 Tax=Neisseria lisongii TaxID=2912188 RepID=A0ABY7RIX1_9NEIS|nr:deoxyribodipyrimidine photo-lyase [Neisseria lisongii]MCF7520969.1 DNA photolyase family protein [Neisseria lisongii]WCL71228.1 deoxyribodipyrimidine photo-lyase [Neisseria lisongii]